MDTIEKIERIMKRRGWTKYKLAKASGLPQTTITSLFSGRVKAPSTETLTKIALALGVSVSRLLGEDEIPLFDVSVQEKNKMRESLHDGLTKVLAILHNGGFNEENTKLTDLKEKYKNLLGDGHLHDRYLYEELYDEIYDLPVTCNKFREFSNLLNELIKLSKCESIDTGNDVFKESPSSYTAEKELFDKSLELSDEEIKQKYDFKVDGRELTEEEYQRMIAAVRAERLYRDSQK